MKYGYLIDMDGVIHRGSEAIPVRPSSLLICKRSRFRICSSRTIRRIRPSMSSAS
jgi:ribonucleotide monophosphatase NagD (HAD superfamily)